MNQTDNIRKLRGLVMPGQSNSVGDIRDRLSDAQQANQPPATAQVNPNASQTYNFFRHSK